MEIKRSGSQPSGKGPAEYFTGTVRVDPLFNPPAPARAFGASVTFEPGARTAWHTHPLGQTLIVTAGCGRAQRWGGPVEEIRPGDVVWIPPGEKHWHGAAPTTAMTHIAIQEQLDGKAVDWMEQVTRRTIPGLIKGERQPTGALIHVQGEGLLRSQCDIAACLHDDRAARSKRTRRTDRDPLLRYLPLRSPPGPQRMEWCHADGLPLRPRP